MSCSHEDRIDAFIDGELDAREADAFSGHLGTCARCREAVEQVRALDGELRARFRPWRTSHDAFAAGVIARSRAVTPLKQAPRSWIAAAALIAVVGGFGAGWAVFHGQAGSDGPRGRPEIGTPVSDAPSARLVISTGVVEVMGPNDGHWSPLPLEAVVPAGAHLRTYDGAKCVLVLFDGSELRVAAGSEVQLPGQRAIGLPRGRVFLRVAPSATPFDIATLDGHVVTHDGRIDISCTPDPQINAATGETAPASTAVVVVEGTAFIGKTTVAVGFGCRIVEGICGRPERIDDPLLQTNWIHELLVASPRNAELEDRLTQLIERIGRNGTNARAEAELRTLGDQALPPLARFIESPASQAEPGRRCRAVTILADLANVSVVCNLLALLSDLDPEVRSEAARGLERLTGETLGFDATYWRGLDTSGGCSAWTSYLRRPGSVWNRCQPLRG